jgi:hypothetical protein
VKASTGIASFLILLNTKQPLVCIDHHTLLIMTS